MSYLVFNCPFCGLEAAVKDMSVDGRERTVVCHAVPACKEFETHAAAEYLDRCLARMYEIN